MTRCLPLAWILVVGATACTGVFSDPGQTPPTPLHELPIGNLVFATRTLYQGGYLGGLDGADTTCQHDAGAAGLPGTFKAWLSQYGTSAASRMTHATTPYVLVDGTRIADDWPDLIHADLHHAIDLDETGAAAESSSVWTDTLFSGEPYPWMPGGTMTDNPRLDCGDWDDLTKIGMLGSLVATNANWSETSTGIFCTEKAHLYCFEQ